MLSLRSRSVGVRVPFNFLRTLTNHKPFFPKDESPVLFTEYGKKAVITLNQPKRLNALIYQMVFPIYTKLKRWRHNKDLIIMNGTGESFCAGGNVAELANFTLTERKEFCKLCYYALHHINALIISLKIPYLAIMHGIVMGGGVGLSVHGKYRLATETSVFAMPETQIGLFPDVGVSHFLARMPNRLGVFLALTGHKLKGFDLNHTGIATHFCHSSLLSDLKKEVLKPETDVVAVLDAFHAASIERLPQKKEPHFSLTEELHFIEDCFSAPTVEEIVERLQKVDNKLMSMLLKNIKYSSPLSLKATFEQIKRALDLDVYEALNQDYRLGSTMMTGYEFCEGVRALLIDKDKKPQWTHASLEDLTDEKLKQYFDSLDKEDDLNLPASLGRAIM